jgi:hypothetical protein
VDRPGVPSRWEEPVNQVQLQGTLWAAATMVAESATAAAKPPTYLPLSDGTSQLARVELAAPAATVAPPMMAPVAAARQAADPASMPGFIATRPAPDSLQWFVFGGTAAFLGVIWVAIWLVVGK